MKNSVTIGLLLVVLSTAKISAADCEKLVNEFRSNKTKQYLVSATVDLPKEFKRSGSLEIIGYRCMSAIKEGQPIKMVMGKQVAQPQFDIIYTAPDGIRFSNILQAPVMSWGDSIKIDMISTVVADVLKHFKSFKQQTPFDQKIIYLNLRESAPVKSWAAARAIRISEFPLKYAYPLPSREVELLERSKLSYQKILESIHKVHVKNVIQQPENLLDNFLKELTQDKPRRKVLAAMSATDSFKGAFFKELSRSRISQIKNIVTMKKDALDGQAIYRVHYVSAHDEAAYVRKFRMKRVGNKWYVSAVDKPKLM